MNIGGPAVSWAVTLVLVGAVLLAGADAALRRADWRQLVDGVCHVVLGVALISMVWAWGAVVPVMALVLVFTAAAAWFVGRVVFRDPTVTVAGPPVVLWYPAAIMAAMVFMAVAMNAQSATVTGPEEAMAGMDMAGMHTPGMDMSGMSMSGVSWVQVSCLLVAVFFLAAAAAWVGDAVRPRGPRAARAGVANALMAVGLAAVFAQMA